MASSPWLLPALARLSRLAVRAFYRLEVAGRSVPPDGPALLVANHPNSLVDPAAVSAAAGRPVRFLAKAPLFTDPLVGWLVKAVGAIPVHRRQDPGADMGENARAFEAVQRALAGGDAVGIFPEGRSHDDPQLSPLKTGAARLALGAAREVGAFPIVPFGLTFPHRDRFRSEGLVLIGAPVAWDDVAGRGDDDVEAVRELTARIDDALRRVTLNLERWEDQVAIETAEAIHAAESAGRRDDVDRLARLHEATALLARLRASDPEKLRALLPDLDRYGRTLRALGIDALGVERLPRRGAVLRWVLRLLALLAVGGPVAAVGTVLFFVPHRVTGLLAGRPSLTLDTRATWKLLGGFATFTAWIVLLAGLAGWVAGWEEAAACLVGLPLVAVVTQSVLDRLGDALVDARRYLRLAGRESLRTRLLTRRRELAAEIERLRRHVGGVGDTTLSRRRAPGATTRRPPRPRTESR